MSGHHIDIWMYHLAFIVKMHAIPNNLFIIILKLNPLILGIQQIHKFNILCQISYFIEDEL